jgi:hypothetical protein
MFKKGGKFDKALRKLDKAADKVGRDLDSNMSKSLGLEDGAKISHALNTDSPHHKEAVQGLKEVFVGEKDSIDPMTSGEPAATEPVLEELILNSDMASATDLAASIDVPEVPTASEDVGSGDIYIIGDVYGNNEEA